MAYNDPRWINSRFDGKDRDGNPVKRGQRVLYYPKSKALLSGEKAEQAWRDFEAACSDESAYNA